MCSIFYCRAETNYFIAVISLPETSWHFQNGTLLVQRRLSYRNATVLSTDLGLFCSGHDMITACESYTSTALWNGQWFHRQACSNTNLGTDWEPIQDGKEIVFVWAPDHVGISSKSAADSAAKDALDDDVSNEYIPFSDLTPHLNNYIADSWQNEYPLNKLHRSLLSKWTSSDTALPMEQTTYGWLILSC